MRNKFLKLEKPCDEKWEKMLPTEKGSYCNLCSKNVIDFTKLNQFEISETIKKSGDKICARLTHTQLNAALLNIEPEFKFTIPHSNVAAGLMLATTLTLGQTAHAENRSIKTEFVQSSDSIVNSKKEKPSPKLDNSKLDNLTILKGKVTSSETGKPIENAKITLVTMKQMFSANTSQNGTFSIEIPTNLIDDDNVIRVSYYEVKEEEKENKMFFGYETKDYILSKKEIATEYLIKAEPEVIYVGGIGSYSDKRKPIVLSNGVEIKYREFVKAQLGKKSSCSLENKDYEYFEPKIAIAIYGKKAKDGLYIITDKAVN